MILSLEFQQYAQRSGELQAVQPGHTSPCQLVYAYQRHFLLLRQCDNRCLTRIQCGSQPSSHRLRQGMLLEGGAFLQGLVKGQHAKTLLPCLAYFLYYHVAK